MTDMTDTLASALVPDFRKAMRRLAATVTLITTVDPTGRRHGMVATAVNSVTMDPPTLLICVNRTASLHAPLIERGRFCISVLMPAHHELVGHFSGQKAGEDRFAFGDWRVDDTSGLPYLHGAQCNLFCRLASVTAVGTHSVIIAAVEAVQVQDDVMPLIYANGGLHAIGDTVS